MLVLRLQTAALATGGPSAASATMPKAHSDDLAWRVVFRWHFLGQTYEEVCDVTHGLGVSRRYVDNVLKRFENSGDVATHQGQGADPMDKRALSRLEDWQIMRLIVESPRTTLKDHHAQFVLESGVIITYQAFCRAVARLGFSRKKIRSVAYQCDMQRADAFLAELLTFYCADELGVLDETSKELASLKSDLNADGGRLARASFRRCQYL